MFRGKSYSLIKFAWIFCLMSLLFKNYIFITANCIYYTYFSFQISLIQFKQVVVHVGVVYGHTALKRIIFELIIKNN